MICQQLFCLQKNSSLIDEMTDTETEAEEMTPATSEESMSVLPSTTTPVQKKHSKYDVMIKRALSALKSKSGSSKKAITRYIVDNNSVKKEHALDATLRGLKRMLKTGHVSKNKAGRFKLVGNLSKVKVRSAGRRKRGGRRTKKSRKGRKRRRTARRNKKRRKTKRGKKRRKGGRRRR